MHSKNIVKLITYNSLELALTHDDRTHTVQCGCCVFRSKTASELLQCNLSGLFQKHLALIVQLILNSFWLRMQKFFLLPKFAISTFSYTASSLESLKPDLPRMKMREMPFTQALQFQGVNSDSKEQILTADLLKKHCLKEAQQLVCLVQCFSSNSEFP